MSIINIHGQTGIIIVANTFGVRGHQIVSVRYMYYPLSCLLWPFGLQFIELILYNREKRHQVVFPMRKEPPYLDFLQGNI